MRKMTEERYQYWVYGVRILMNALGGNEQDCSQPISSETEKLWTWKFWTVGGVFIPDAPKDQRDTSPFTFSIPIERKDVFVFYYIKDVRQINPVEVFQFGHKADINQAIALVDREVRLMLNLPTASGLLKELKYPLSPAPWLLDANVSDQLLNTVVTLPCFVYQKGKLYYFTVGGWETVATYQDDVWTLAMDDSDAYLALLSHAQIYHHLSETFDKQPLLAIANS